MGSKSNLPTYFDKKTGKVKRKTGCFGRKIFLTIDCKKTIQKDGNDVEVTETILVAVQRPNRLRKAMMMEIARREAIKRIAEARRNKKIDPSKESEPQTNKSFFSRKMG